MSKKAEMTFADFEKAKKGAAKKALKKGPVHSMRVEPAELNGVKGYMTTAHHEPPAGHKNGMMDHDAMTSRAFHSSAEEMGSHHSVMMGGKQMIPGTPEQAAESEASGAGDPNAEK